MIQKVVREKIRAKVADIKNRSSGNREFGNAIFHCRLPQSTKSEHFFFKGQLPH